MIMPMNMVTASPPSIASVVAALRDFGLRNAGTPLLIASTPVRAAQPRRTPGHQEDHGEAHDVAVLGLQLEARGLRLR